MNFIFTDDGGDSFKAQKPANYAGLLITTIGRSPARVVMVDLPPEEVIRLKQALDRAFPG